VAVEEVRQAVEAALISQEVVEERRNLEVVEGRTLQAEEGKSEDVQRAPEGGLGGDHLHYHIR
jgi:hypothetical protein